MQRYELQAELFGLTTNQRNQAINFVDNAVQGERVNVIGDYVNRVQTVHGNVEVVVEISFTAKASGDRIFDTCRSWAATRADDTPEGQHSYIWLKQVDDVTGQIDTRYAESPGWVEQDSTDPLFARPA